MSSISDLIRSFGALSLKETNFYPEQAELLISKAPDGISKKISDIIAEILEANNSLVSNESIDFFSKLLFDTNFFWPSLEHRLKPELFVSIPKNLFLLIRDMRDLRDTLVLRPLNSECLQIRLLPNPRPGSNLFIEIHDPELNDLARCQYVFLKMFLHVDKTAKLEEFLPLTLPGIRTEIESSIFGAFRPSSPAIRAMEVLKKLKKLTGTSTLFFVDTLPRLLCNSKCKQNVLVSDRSIQVLKSGNSVYENQGASADFELPHTLMKEKPLDVHLTPKVYKAAKDFLYRLTISELQWILEQLSADYPKIQEINKSFDAILKTIKISGSETLGRLLNAIEKSQSKHAHQNTHVFYDFIVLHRDSVFSTIGVKKILKKDLSPISFAVAIQVLTEIPMLDMSNEMELLEITINRPNPKPNSDELPYQEEFENNLIKNQRKLRFLKEYSSKSEFTYLYDILLGNEIIEAGLLSIYDQYLHKRKDSVLDEIQQNSSIVGARVIPDSTLLHRKRWRQYSCDRGIRNYMEALIPTLKWLGSLTLSEFQQISPVMSVYFQGFSPNLQIRGLLIELEEMNSREHAEEFLKEIILHLKKSFSGIVINSLKRYRINPESFDPEERYLLWKLAKLTVDQYSIFALE